MRRGPHGSREDASGAVTAAGAIRLVAGREIRTRLTSKAYLITTAVLVLGVVLAGVLIGTLGSSEPTTRKVGLVPESGPLGPVLSTAAAGYGLEIETVELASRAQGEEQVRSGDLDALVVGPPASFDVVVESTLDEGLSGALTAVSQQQALVAEIDRLGGDPGAVGSAIATAAPRTIALAPASQTSGAQQVAGFLVGILLFISLQTMAQLVAVGVIEEKQSRVVELLLATIRPWQLLVGKVLGIGAIGLLQLGSILAAAGATAWATGIVDPGSLDIGAAAGWALAWYVLGFAAYAFLVAGLASLVSRQEDAGSVVTPVILLMILPYILGVSVAPWAPDNPLVVWGSMVPLFAPLLMPIRIALGTAQGWEIAVALSLSVAIVPLLIWAAGRIYSRAILRMGARVRMRDALRRS